jgi:hypothetical protein
MAKEINNRQDGSQPKARSKQSTRDKLQKRGSQTLKSNFRGKDISLGLMDIDTVIVEYFENAIKPEVMDSTGQRIQVPIMYGNPERWASIQKSRVYRDENGQLQLPLIMFKRTSIEKNRNLGRKMDSNSPKLYQGFQNEYSTLNKYDNFAKLQGMQRKKHLKKVVVPDYIDLSYDFIVTTEFLEQMNGIVEAINYAEGSYWGVKEKFNFKSKIDSFDNAVEMDSGADRVITTNFSLTLSGFLIPDVLQRKLNAESQDVITSMAVKINESTMPQEDFPNTMPPGDTTGIRFEI